MGARKNRRARYPCVHLFSSAATQATFLVVCYTVLRVMALKTAVYMRSRLPFLWIQNKRSKANFTVGNIYFFYQYFGRHGLPSSGSFRVFLVDDCSVHVRWRISVSQLSLWKTRDLHVV